MARGANNVQPTARATGAAMTEFSAKLNAAKQSQQKHENKVQMKEITSYASNFCAVINSDRTIEPQSEIALVLSDIEYRYTSNGTTAKERICQTVRFCSSPKGLRALASLLNKTADESEAEFKAAMLTYLTASGTETTKAGPT